MNEFSQTDAAVSDGQLDAAYESEYASQLSVGVPGEVARLAAIAKIRALLTGATNEQRMSDAARDVLAERARQVIVEGWTPTHDDQHDHEDLALAAIVYAESAIGYHASCPDTWPWSPKWFKPTTPRRDLIKAGALILAEIERIDTAQEVNRDT